jgi:hypothetical protein
MPVASPPTGKTVSSGLYLADGGSSMMVNEISGVKIPDSQLAREATQFIRDTESDLLFQHSTRVYMRAPS